MTLGGGATEIKMSFKRCINVHIKCLTHIDRAFIKPFGQLAIKFLTLITSGCHLTFYLIGCHSLVNFICNYTTVMFILLYFSRP